MNEIKNNLKSIDKDGVYHPLHDEIYDQLSLIEDEIYDDDSADGISYEELDY